VTAESIQLANITISGIIMIFKELNHAHHNSDIAYQTVVDSASNILTQASFSLLEERLRIELIQRKVGEIVIRKEIETELVRVEVPVQREKLIIEQVSPVYELLAKIDLGQPINSSNAIVDSISDNVVLTSNDEESNAVGVDALSENLDRRIASPTVYGSTDSLRAASKLLEVLASLPSHDCGAIQIEIALKDSKHQASYQALVDRYCQS
jgi:uncharacterized protein (TIGR02271 family)